MSIAATSSLGRCLVRRAVRLVGFLLCAVPFSVVWADDGQLLPSIIPSESTNWPLPTVPETLLLFPPADAALSDISVKETNGALGAALPLREPPEADPTRVAPQFTEEDFERDLPVVTFQQTPTGFAGPTGVFARDPQRDAHFVPIADRWRIGYPFWDRYGSEQRVRPKGDPFENDNPFARGAWWNPYRQNVLKGDYPIFSQHTFLNLTVTSKSNFETRQVPTPTPFESTEDPFQEELFGDPNQFFLNQNWIFSIDLVHGDAGFKPADWRVKITPIVNLNYLDVEETGIVRPDVRDGTTRYRDDVALEEFFVETKLADTSPYYDFTSLRVGSQQFVSDFRGFVFADVNLGARIFGTRRANRDQFNLIFFNQFEKETNSLLNTTDNRDQNTFIANYYRQDFIWPGYTGQWSVHYNQDRGKGLVYDKNGFLVRPDPAGVFQPHQIDAVYLGWTGDGHINRFNISHALYLVYGEDDLNPLSGQRVDIDAQMLAVELSYDRDWMRFRSSMFYASGDDDIFDDKAEGFDAIFDNPNFAGGEFSFWQRQAIQLQGVRLVDRMSLVPRLRSSKFQGQTNFVNPGLWIANFGIDADVTPRLKTINNVNLLYFDHTQVLEQFVFQSGITHHIGTDISSGIEYRPILNDNLIIAAGISGLIPGAGLDDLYAAFADNQLDSMFASFIEVTATY